MRVWMNLFVAPVSETTKMAWYKVINDIMPTKERLHKIKISPTAVCKTCTHLDTLIHRLTSCGEGKTIWGYVKALMAQTLQTTPRQIPDTWLLQPQFNLRPPKCRNAFLWLLATIIQFRTQQKWKLTLQDFLDFLKRRWKLMASGKPRESVGNYLVVIDEDAAGTNVRD
jgi:hypothetical protein